MPRINCMRLNSTPTFIHFSNFVEMDKHHVLSLLRLHYTLIFLNCTKELKSVIAIKRQTIMVGIIIK